MWNANEQYGRGEPDCRRYVMPACEPDGCSAPTAQIPAVATFTIRQRDSWDYTFDASVWVGANGNPVVTGATWAVASGSPQTPTLTGQAFTAQGVAVVVVTPANGAKPGDAYWLDLTVTVGAASATTDAPAIPARTFVRRIYIIVTAG